MYKNYKSIYGAQNETYLSPITDKRGKPFDFNELRANGQKRGAKRNVSNLTSVLHQLYISGR